MKSATTKVMHSICGRPLVGHAVAAAAAIDPQHLLVVVGHGREQVRPYLSSAFPAARLVVQEEQNGTGHAVRIALDEITPPDGTVVVTYGDVPLLTTRTLRALLDAHGAGGNAATVLTAVLDAPGDLGRVIRDRDGGLAAIVEVGDASEEQRRIEEINSGIYAFDAKLLHDALGRLTTTNAQGEQYLTDVIGLLREDDHRVGAVAAADPRETIGVNDRIQLAQIRRLRNDSTVVEPATTWIDVDVAVAADTVIQPGTRLEGRTSVSRGAEVGPDSTLRDTAVGEGATVSYSVCMGAEIGAEASVGPYAYLRPGAVLARGAKVGTFVEVKNSEIGEGTKVPHLSYVGDATIGDYTNIGAASVFVNYDGVAKHRTTIGSHARTGSDNMFIAPVSVGDGAYTGAGTVVREDVPAGALAVNVAPQRNIEGWVERKRPGTPSAEAARAAQAHTGTDKPENPDTSATPAE